MAENPKLAGTNIVDCIPQTGECPNHCAECFYNGGRFYRTLDEPLIPDAADVAGKLVRMNSGHDSNISRQLVVAVACEMRRRGAAGVFFNTSIPNFAFPGPVVFTCNGREPLFVDIPPHVMFVRVRCNTWDMTGQDALVEHYGKFAAPIVMTFMGYYNRESVPEAERPKYRWKVHVTNPYWRPTEAAILEVMGRYEGRGVRMCGTPASSFCRDCLNCEHLYWAAMRRCCYAPGYNVAGLSAHNDIGPALG